MSPLLPAALVGSGLALIALGFARQRGRHQPTLAEMLSLEEAEPPPADRDFDFDPTRPNLSGVVVRAGAVLQRLDARGALDGALQRAHLRVKAGEYLAIVGLGAILVAVLAGLVSGSPLLGLAVAAVAAGVGAIYPGRRAKKRSAAIRAQLPEAFGLIASAVKAGHTFLRSIQMLGEQIPEPLSSELQQVTAEVALGSDLVTALEHMAGRANVVELTWSVRGVKIQQSTGGSLAEILRTLADFMLVREEVHREVNALTAEGKFSGYVLMVMPVAMAGLLTVSSPGYLDPMFHGVGLALLGVAVVMEVIGGVIIKRMVKVEV